MIKTIIIILLILFIVYNFPAVLLIDRNRAKKMTELGIKDKAEYIDNLIDEDIKIKKLKWEDRHPITFTGIPPSYQVINNYHGRRG